MSSLEVSSGGGQTQEDDVVRAEMANGAPATTDWVRLIWVNYGIIFGLIRHERSVKGLFAAKKLIVGSLSCWVLSPSRGCVK